MSANAQPRPLKLQINTAGAWRDVIRFDLSDGDEVLHHAENLALRSAHAGQVSLRVIIPGDTAPLQLWTRQRGWFDWQAR